MRYRTCRAALRLAVPASVAVALVWLAVAVGPAPAAAAERPAPASDASHPASGPGLTTTYRWVDAQGVIHFSDTPQPGAERLEIPPAQSFGPLPAPAASPAATSAGDQGSIYQSCRIAEPGAEQAFYAPESVAVQVQLIPALRPSDQLTVRVDGQPLAPANGERLSFHVDGPFRGAHTITAIVTDAGGHPVCMAPPVTFYVQRPSLLSPQSPARGHSVPTAPRH